MNDKPLTSSLSDDPTPSVMPPVITVNLATPQIASSQPDSDSLLDAIGGEPLEGSGFENEKPD